MAGIRSSSYHNRRPVSSTTIGVRLPSEVSAVLAQHASIHKLSIHEYARVLVVESLFQSESFNQLAAALECIQAESKQLRQDLAFSMKTLLMTAGNYWKTKLQSGSNGTSTFNPMVSISEPLCAASAPYYAAYYHKHTKAQGLWRRGRSYQIQYPIPVRSPPSPMEVGVPPSIENDRHAAVD